MKDKERKGWRDGMGRGRKEDRKKDQWLKIDRTETSDQSHWIANTVPEVSGFHIKQLCMRQ